MFEEKKNTFSDSVCLNKTILKMMLLSAVVAKSLTGLGTEGSLIMNKLVELKTVSKNSNLY